MKCTKVVTRMERRLAKSLIPIKSRHTLCWLLLWRQSHGSTNMGGLSCHFKVLNQLNSIHLLLSFLCFGISARFSMVTLTLARDTRAVAQRCCQTTVEMSGGHPVKQICPVLWPQSHIASGRIPYTFLILFFYVSRIHCPGPWGWEKFSLIIWIQLICEYC